MTGGSYIFQHMGRKFLNHVITQNGWSFPQACENLNWMDVLGFAWPDESDHWKNVIHKVPLQELAKVCTPPWHLAMYSCLLKRGLGSDEQKARQWLFSPGLLTDFPKCQSCVEAVQTALSLFNQPRRIKLAMGTDPDIFSIHDNVDS